MIYEEKVERDLDILTRTIIGEANNQPYSGQVAVAQTVMNRLNKGGHGKNVADVALQPNQYSAWNPVGQGGNTLTDVDKSSAEYRRARKVAEDVYFGKVSDPTRGATMYYARDYFPLGPPQDHARQAQLMRGIDQKGIWKDIGDHRFLVPDPIPRMKPGPNPVDPVQQSGALHRQQVMDEEIANRPPPYGMSPEVYQGFQDLYGNNAAAKWIADSAGEAYGFVEGMFNSPTRNVPPPEMMSDVRDMDGNIVGKYTGNDMPPVRPSDFQYSPTLERDIAQLNARTESEGRALEAANKRMSQAHGQRGKLGPDEEDPGLWDKIAGWLEEGDNRKLMMHYGMALAAAEPTQGGVDAAIRKMAQAGLETEGYKSKLEQQRQLKKESESLIKGRLMSDMEKELTYIRRLAESPDKLDQQLGLLAAAQFVGKGKGRGTKVTEALVNAVMQVYPDDEAKRKALSELIDSELGIAADDATGVTKYEDIAKSRNS